MLIQVKHRSLAKLLMIAVLLFILTIEGPRHARYGAGPCLEVLAEH